MGRITGNMSTFFLAKMNNNNNLAFFCTKIVQSPQEQGEIQGKTGILAAVQNGIGLRAAVSNELNRARGLTPGIIRGSIRTIEEKNFYFVLDELEKYFLVSKFKLGGRG